MSASPLWFNALVANAQAQAANFPFCTIEPNVGSVAVPDERLDRLTQLSSSLNTIPTRMEFVDIAGLVKVASRAKAWATNFCPTSVRSTRSFT